MKPRILLTCGDVNGIGPELILKIFNNPDIKNGFDIKVIGPVRAFNFYSKELKIKNIPVKDILNLTIANNFEITPGSIDASAGRISGDAIKLGIDLCRKKYFDALVTLPINKESLNLGGYTYRGHTEMLSHLTASKDTFMLMYSPVLKIVPLTIHIPVKKISSSISKNLIIEKVISINNVFVKTFKIKKPIIAILSVNPHSGDGGVIGKEEIKIITPAIKILKDTGFNIEGPFSADGFFGNKMYKKFNVVISMYHDQGLIPFKMLAGENGVNFTGGLKIIRTSPSHGSAFDISGKGIANESSTIEAIKLAAKLAGN
jgi:4-hydroxythreonine-4-phosphate dehydrogenase